MGISSHTRLNGKICPRRHDTLKSSTSGCRVQPSSQSAKNRQAEHEEFSSSFGKRPMRKTILRSSNLTGDDSAATILSRSSAAHLEQHPEPILVSAPLEGISFCCGRLFELPWFGLSRLPGGSRLPRHSEFGIGSAAISLFCRSRYPSASVADCAEKSVIMVCGRLKNQCGRVELQLGIAVWRAEAIKCTSLSMAFKYTQYLTSSKY
jgi:hypothetical protein